MKKKIISLIIALVLFVGLGFAGKAMKTFDSFTQLFDEIKFNPSLIITILIMFALMACVNYVLQLLFSLLSGKSGRTGTLATVFSSLIKYLTVLIAICWMLKILGLDITTIFAGVGIMALILGFGAESLVADVVTGIFILFENQYNVGDIIEVDGFRGTVEKIGIRTISIKDTGSNIKIINNSDIKNLVNRSDQASVSVSLVGISYSTDLRKVDEVMPKILERIKKSNPDVFVGDVKYLGVEDLAESSVNLKFVAEVKEKDIFNGRRLLNKEIKNSFDDEGIVIAFPQIDIHNK